MRIFILLFLSLNINNLHAEQRQTISFPTADGGSVEADYYPAGLHGIVLAHGAIFNKESWQSFSKQLNNKGFSVLAINFRGYGNSVSGKKPAALYEDILAGVNFLKQQKHIKKVSVLGASMGGAAAAEAAIHAKPSDIYKLILLSPANVSHPEQLKGSILFIASQDEFLRKTITAQFNAAPGPKQLRLIPGKAHAQHIFKGKQAALLSESILEFLSAAPE